MGIGADLQVGPALALVHQAVHIAQQREADPFLGLRELRDGTHVDHLMHRRGQRDPGPGERRDAGAPHSAGDDHELGLDLAAVGEDPADAAGLDAQVEHLGLGMSAQRPEPVGALTHQVPGPHRVHDRAGGGVEPAAQQARVAVGHELLDLGGGDQVRLDAPGPRRAHPPRQLLHPLRTARHLDAAADGQHLQLLELPQ